MPIVFGKSWLVGWRLSPCAGCGGHDGVRKLGRIPPGTKYALADEAKRAPWVYVENKCRDCGALNYVVPVAKTA